MDVCEYGKSNKIQRRNTIGTNWSRHCLRQWVEVTKTYLIVESRLERSTPGAARQQVYLLFPAPPLQTTILADVNHRMSVINGTAQWRKVDEEKSSHWRKVGADQFPGQKGNIVGRAGKGCIATIAKACLLLLGNSFIKALVLNRQLKSLFIEYEQFTSYKEILSRY